MTFDLKKLKQQFILWIKIFKFLKNIVEFIFNFLLVMEKLGNLKNSKFFNNLIW